MPDSPVALSWRRNPELPKLDGSQLRTEEDGSQDLRLIGGDNLSALSLLKSEIGDDVSLAYLDPPFLTERQHKTVQRWKDPKTGKILRRETDAFDDRWGGMGPYLDSLGPRLEAVRSLLSPHGSVVLHVDPKTSHYLKVLCDEIFGPECFVSEIIWRYRRWPAKTPNYQRVHDVLLRYVKDSHQKPRFNQLYEPLAPSTLATWGKRKQRAVTDKSGRRLRSSSTKEDTPGAPMGDVWEIGIVAPVAKERTGYPTQKPKALLTRLVEGLTDPGDLVLDPYVGSGTTLEVAGALGRRAVGIDQNPDALRICKERLAAQELSPRIQQLARVSENKSLAS